MTFTNPPIAEGETYISIVGDQKGEVYHLILLPGDNEGSFEYEEIDASRAKGQS